MTPYVRTSDNKLNVIAAILAVSNMGQPKPSIKDVKALKELGDKCSLGTAVMRVAEQYMETDEHQKMFMREAKSFLLDLKKGIRKARKAWPDVFELYENA